MTKMTVATLQTLRDEEHSNQFWKWLMNAKKEIDVDEPELPWLRKQPRHFEIGTSGPECFDDVKAMYRQV